MENKLKKKRIRRISLAVLVVVCLIGIYFGLDVEKADYKEALAKTITEAENTLEESEVGYDKGQYTPKTAESFSKEIEKAKKICSGNEANYENCKAAYEKLKGQIKKFKKSANKEDIKRVETGKKETKKGKEQVEETEKDKDEGKKQQEKPVKGEKEKEKPKEKAKPEEEYITVTIQIRCDNISNNMSKLTSENKADWIPKSGVILQKTKYKCKKGTTVYDVLYAVCRNNNIQVESTYTPVYGSYYIEGLNHLYEFDAGGESGWMYRVNGGYPEYGCSSKKVKDGDDIVWAYTCNLGKDL